jgi:hypothetical protein
MEIVKQPQYKPVTDKRSKTRLSEFNHPNGDEYFGLGFQSKIQNTKHYRLQIDRPLEDSMFMGQDQYTTLSIFRGKRTP